MARYTKAIVALIMAILGFLVEFGIDTGLNEQQITGAVGVITAILVYALPNRP
jgi:hypothetical protein